MNKNRITVEEYKRNIKEAADYILSKIPADYPKAMIGLTLGSGLSKLGEMLQEPRVTIPYREIPNFPITKIAGHAGDLIYGQIQKDKDSKPVPVLCFSGRVHGYEGYPAHVVTFYVQVLSQLGARILILTNAAGGAIPGMKKGSVMAIEDSVAFHTTNILEDIVQDRDLFPEPLSDDYTYSRRLLGIAHECAKDIGINLFQGTYYMMTGPTYESHAEIVFAMKNNGSAFGMSTAVEATVARQAGLEVYGMSLITNLAAGLEDEELTHDDVKEVALSSMEVLRLTREMVDRIGNDPEFEYRTPREIKVNPQSSARIIPRPVPVPTTDEMIKAAREHIGKVMGKKEAPCAVFLPTSRFLEACPKGSCRVSDIPYMPLFSDSALTGRFARVEQGIAFECTDYLGYFKEEAEFLLHALSGLCDRVCWVFSSDVVKESNKEASLWKVRDVYAPMRSGFSKDHFDNRIYRLAAEEGQILAQTSFSLAPGYKWKELMEKFKVDLWTSSDLSGVILSRKLFKEVSVFSESISADRVSFDEFSKFVGVSPSKDGDASECAKGNVREYVRPPFQLSQGDPELISAGIDRLKSAGADLRTLLVFPGDFAGLDIGGSFASTVEVLDGVVIHFNTEKKCGYVKLPDTSLEDGEKAVKNLMRIFSGSGGLNIYTFGKVMSIDSKSSLGDVVVFDDIIRAGSLVPLYGTNNDSWGDRFIDYSSPFQNGGLEKTYASGVVVHVNETDLGACPYLAEAYKGFGIDYLSGNLEIYTTVARHIRSRIPEFKMCCVGVVCYDGGSGSIPMKKVIESGEVQKVVEKILQ